jgi:Flp pilus assembly CpaE family ATPase
VTVPVLAAVSGASWEADLVAALEGGASGVTVVRRCVDLADLLAAAAAGTARAALVSGELRRLDRDALTRLALSHVGVVALVTPGDDVAEARLRQLGVDQVLRADSALSDIAAAVIASSVGRSRALGNGDRAAAHSYGDPAAALPDLTAVSPRNGSAAGPGQEAGLEAGPDGGSEVVAGSGQLVAVWGPTGAPGRTTVAVGVAGELAAAGLPTLLADADTYGGAVAQLLGLLDEAPGLAAAARLANLGQLDLAALARVAPVATRHLRVLTGISRAERWTELRPAALEEVWTRARSLAAVTVVDCGFSLEQDEELSFDTAAPRRNGATLATLAAADTVVAVGAADPIGVHRLVRGLGDLHEAVPGVRPVVVLTKVRPSVVGADPQAQLAAALERYAGVHDPRFVPHDSEPLDDALRQGRLLSEVAPDSAVRLALRDLALSLCGRAVPARRRRLLRRT